MGSGMKKILLLGVSMVIISTFLTWFHLNHLAAPSNVHQKLTDEEEFMIAEAHRKKLALNCPTTTLMMNATEREKYEGIKHMSNYTKGSYQVYKDRILILTPVSNSAKRLAHYFGMLCTLSYPHQLISVALGEDSSTDKTFEIAQTMAQRFQPYFDSIKVFHFEDKMNRQPLFSRHDSDLQLERRAHLAHARNQLLVRALDDHDWVLWIDSDVKFVPQDLIQHLLSAKSDITVPSCMYRESSGKVLVYDRNTWRETNRSLEFQRIKPRDYLMLEGYSLSMRIYLPYLAHEGVKVPIDGVGGCVLLVRADCHRKGLNFPPFVFEHHIETEGLAKMAAKMGFSVVGLPMVSVFHV